ncbi:hypothetical protein JW977_05000 [Candidatus Falkowbacteria bacterium]|nr:hypothetical protein [Candidatus Falkowbacteria bacterium]
MDSKQLEKYIGSQAAIQDQAKDDVYRGEIKSIEVAKEILRISFTWLFVMNFGWKPVKELEFSVSLSNANFNEDDGISEIEIPDQKKKVIFFPAESHSNFTPEYIRAIRAPGN